MWPQPSSSLPSPCSLAARLSHPTSHHPITARNLPVSLPAAPFSLSSCENRSIFGLGQESCPNFPAYGPRQFGFSPISLVTAISTCFSTGHLPGHLRGRFLSLSFSRFRPANYLVNRGFLRPISEAEFIRLVSLGL